MACKCYVACVVDAVQFNRGTKEGLMDCFVVAAADVVVAEWLVGLV